MKKLLAFLVIICSCWLPVHAQALHVDSTRFITGLHVGTLIQFAIPTSDKGVLFVGEDYRNPGGIIPYFPIDTGGNGNVLVGKIDSNQRISWIKVYGGSDADAAQSVCQTPDGGYAVFAGTVSTDGNVTGFKGGGGDFWLLKLDASGNLLWEKTYGSTAQDAPISIANTPDHGFIMLGLTNGSNDDVPFHYGDFFSFDWLVIKTDSLGNKQWSKDMGGTGDEGNGSVLAIDNSYYIVSCSNSTDHDCSDSAWHPGVNTSSDYHVLQLNDTGKVLWDSSYGGSSEDAVNYAMFDSRDSTIVIAGSTNSNDYMVTGYQGSGDMWVIKVDKHGKLIWEKTYGTFRPESVSSICISANGGYIVYGSTSGVIGSGDGWIISIDNFGNEITNKIFGGTGAELTYSIVPYLNGFVVTGLSDSKFFTEGTTYGNFDTSSLNPDGGGAFISYIDSSTLGVKNMTLSGPMIKIFPNPSSNSITVFTPKNESGQISIVNYLGQVVWQETQQKEQTNVEVADWNDGVYFIKWRSADGTVQTVRFVKM